MKANVTFEPLPAIIQPTGVTLTLSLEEAEVVYQIANWASRFNMITPYESTDNAAWCFRVKSTLDEVYRAMFGHVTQFSPPSTPKG